MCGASCGVQWINVEAQAKLGSVFNVDKIHPDRRTEAESFNNDQVMICTKCGDKLKGETEAGNNFMMRCVFLFECVKHCQRV